MLIFYQLKLLLKQKLKRGDSKNMKKICILCFFWSFDGGSPRLSEMTPGEKWSSYCSKGHWRALGTIETQETYRKKLLTAEKCKDFKDFKNFKNI